MNAHGDDVIIQGPAGFHQCLPRLRRWTTGCGDPSLTPAWTTHLLHHLGYRLQLVLARMCHSSTTRNSGLQAVRKQLAIPSIFFNAPLQLTQGPAYIVTRVTADDKACEILRRWRVQFGRTKRQTMITTLMRNVLQKLGGNKFTEQLSDGE